MIRALLAVVLAAALLAASLPAVESAAADRTAASLDRDVDRFERAGASLLARDDVGARRVVTVSLPADSLSAVGVDAFTISCQPHCTARYTLDTGASRVHRLSLPLATPDGPVRLSRAGDHRLVLGLDGDNDSRVVTVRG